MEIGLIIGVMAIFISLWSAVHSYRSGKRQSEWQERLLRLEQAEAQRHSIASQSAKLRACLDRNTMAPSLSVTNEGEAQARDISIKIDGTPIMELDRWKAYFIVRDQKEVRQLGPGGSFRYILCRTKGIGAVFQIEISWADEANSEQRWSSELSLAVSGD